MAKLSDAMNALAIRWQKIIDQYDADHIGSSDPEDWMAGHRQCLEELAAELRRQQENYND